MNDDQQADVTEKKAAEPLPTSPDEEVLDWEAYSPPPPPKRSGKIQVRLRKKQAEPLPFPDADAE
jgi:hypothetical protein